MNGLVTLLVVVANTVVLALSGVVTHLAYRAYRRTGERSLGFLALGFALVTLSLLVGGGIHQVLGAGVLTSVFVRDALAALGFAVLVYSLYAPASAPASGSRSR